MPEKPLPVRPISNVLWRRLDEVSLDYSNLQEFAEGYILTGRVLAAYSGRPAEVHYAVLCGPTWLTRHVHVTIAEGTSIRKLELRREADGRWWQDDVALPQLAGVADVDLSVTPATNTLPIRRLGLAVGEARPVEAVWVRIPELTVERLPQRYSRLRERTYRYESGGGAFSAELEVDEAGVVIRYGELWTRVAPL